MRLWHRMNNLRWFWRWPIKVVLFAVVTAFVLFPKVWLVPTWLERIENMNSVLDPGNPELAPLEAEVRATLATESTAGTSTGSGETPPTRQTPLTTSSPTNTPDKAVLQVVQAAVYKRFPYAWDWETWGVCDYLPTVTEVFAKGREDCDGRAVVAASLLRRMGYDAWLVSDLLHVWVETPHGETMSPTGGEKTFVGTKTGTHTTISLHVLANLARGLSYGVAVFPLTRELIILLTFCVLAMNPRSSGWRRVAGCLLLWIALDTLRHAGQQAALRGQMRDVLTAWVGVALVIAGWLVLAVRAADRRPPPDAVHPE